MAGAVIGATVSYATITQAHHAFAAEFDSSKPVVVEGLVTKARIVNPHSWIYLDVRSPNGAVTNWGFEFGSPIGLRSVGVSRETVAPGTKIRLAGYRAKNGGAFGYATTLLLNGKQYRIGGAPDAPPPPIGK